MKNKALRFILIAVFSCLGFIALTLPFHQMLSVFTLSEVRPAAVLYPILGISFGWPAAVGIVCGNFICDWLGGYSLTVLIEGIIPQILYTMIPYYLWNYFTRGEKHPHRLDSVGRVLKFGVVCFSSALAAAICVGIIIATNVDVNFFSVAFFILLNNFVVSISLGCPAMILVNRIIATKRGYDRSLCVNEKIMLVAFIANIISIAILVPLMYKQGTVIGTYDVWNSIYIYSIIIMLIIMFMALVSMIPAERIKTRGN